MENDNLTDLFEVLKSQGVFQTQEQMMSVIESDGLESLYGVMPKGMFNDVQEFSTTFNPVKKKEETMVDSGQPATDTPVLESKSVSPSIDATRFQPPSDGSTLESQPLSVREQYNLNNPNGEQPLMYQNTPIDAGVPVTETPPIDWDSRFFNEPTKKEQSKDYSQWDNTQKMASESNKLSKDRLDESISTAENLANEIGGNAEKIRYEENKKREKEVTESYVTNISEKNNIPKEVVKEKLPDWALESMSLDPEGNRLTVPEGSDKDEVIAFRDKIAMQQIAKGGEEVSDQLKGYYLKKNNDNEELANKEYRAKMEKIASNFISDEDKVYKYILDKSLGQEPDPSLTKEELIHFENKRFAFNKLVEEGMYKPQKQFYDPNTGMFLNNTKDEKIIAFNDKIDEFAKLYEGTNVETMKKDRDEAYLQYQYYATQVLPNIPTEREYGIESSLPNIDRSELNTYEGRKKRALDKYNSGMVGFKNMLTEDVGQGFDETDAFKIVNSGLWDSQTTQKVNDILSKYIALNKSIYRNQDPSNVEEAGFLDMVGKGFKQSLGGTSTSDAELADKTITWLGNNGFETTEEQKDKLEKTILQKTGEAAGGSIIPMIEIGVELAVLNKGAALLKIPELAATLANGNKAKQVALTWAYDLGVQGIAFEGAGQSFATGVGEGIGQKAGEEILGKLGSTNKLFNFLVKMSTGTIAEGTAEYSGELLGELVDNDFELQKAIETTFGKTPEEMAEKAAVTFMMSAMFSVGATNSQTGNVAFENAFMTKAMEDVRNSNSDSPIVKAGKEALEIYDAKQRIIKKTKELEKTTGEKLVANLTEEAVQAEIESFNKENPVATISEPRPTSKAMAKTLKISNGQTSDINVSGEKVGEITTETVGDKVHIRYIDVKGSNQKKGYAKKAYQDAAIEAEKQGKVLASDKLQTNDQAKGVWESLVRDGDAKKNEDGTYEMVKEQPVISSENSSNYANMTEDEDGNFVFFHVGNEGYETIEPKTGGSATSREEASALSKIGGAAMYYTDNKDSERESGSGAKYAVKVPKDKVYDFNSDELGLIEEARTRHEEEHPGKAFDKNTQMAYITKIAGEKGFDMVVGEWNGRTRAQTTKALSPTDTRVDGKQQFQEEFQSNKDKGFESVIPQTRDEKLNEVYDEINDVKNKAGVYDNMYSLKEDALLRNKTQEQITEEVQASDLSQELKDKYMNAIESEVENRRSVKREIETKKLFNEPNPETSEISKGYKNKNGLPESEGSKITSIDEARAKSIADAYEAMEDSPNDPEVQEAYRQLADETLAQYNDIADAGYEVELWEGDSEPYANSEAMLKDLKENKHLFIFSTEEGFGDTAITDEQRGQNAMLEDSGMKDKNGKTLLYNDVFRFVHDFFGHSERGNGFGAIGEENAWDVHARMYSPNARRAMTTETRGQNSWVNFGTQMRDADGNLLKKGDKGYLAPKDRAFAPQKMGLLPEEFSNIIGNEAGISALVAKFKGDNKKVLAQVDNAKKAIAKVSPGTKIIVHNTTDEYTKSGEERTQGEAGAYDLTTDTIHINLENANERTVAHEVFHAILLNKGMSNKQAQSITDRMLEAVKKTASPELIAKIELFSSQYENSLQSEESIAELFGILASEYETLPKPTQSLIKRWLDALAKLFGLKTFTDSDIINMLNTVSGKVQEGVEITNKDIKVIKAKDLDLNQEQGSEGQVGTFNIKDRNQKAPLIKSDTRSFSSLIQEANFKDFTGQKFVTNMYDFTGAGDIELSPGIKLELFGGKSYVPLMMDKQGLKIGDKSNLAAFNSKANAEGFIRNSVESGANLFAPHVGTKEGSWQFQQNIFEQLTYVALNNNILTNKELIKTFNSAILSKNGAKAFKTFKEKLGKNIRNLSSFVNNPEQIVELLNIENNYSPDLRKVLNDKLAGNKKFQEAIGVKNKIQFSEKFEDPLNVGSKGGDLIGLIEFDNKTFEISKPKKTDPDYHPSFAWTIKANINGIYQPTDFHQSSNVTNTYSKYNKNEVSVSDKSKVDEADFIKSNVSSSAGAIPKVAEVSISRKQTPNRPSIEDVRAEAIKLGLSEADLKSALLQLGYTEAEINSTKEQTMADAIDKFKMSQKRGNKKSASVKSAIADMQSTNWYRLASDTSREEAVRELKKEFGVKIKKAPSVKKISGKKADKVTVNEMTALKSQIRLEAKAAKGAVKAYKDASKSLITYIKQMSKGKSITSSQAAAIIKKVMSTNMLNKKSVDNLIKYAEGIFNRAELSDKISKARELNENAKRNLKSKVGASRDLQGILSNLFSIDPSLIPLDMFDMYFDLVSDFGQRKSVLTLKESSQVIKDASDIINNIEEGIAKEEREKLPKEINEEIEADLDAYFGDILSTKIDKSNLDSSEAIELANFLNSLTKEDLESMVRKDKNGFNDYSMLENLKLVKDNLTNGYTPSMASSLKVSVESSRSATEMTDVIKNKSKNINIALLFNRTYGVLKSAFTGKRSMTESVRSTMTTAIDDVLGNFNSKTIYNATFGRLAKAYAAFEADLATNVTVKLDAADFLLNKTRIPTVKRLVNEVQKSKYKIQAYRLQREYESNPESNQVSPAIEFIDATINAIKDNKEGNNLNERDIAILESIKNDFESGGDISMKKIEESFSDNEKKALKLIDEASDMEAKALWTSIVIRGDGMKPINNYVHHNVSTDSEVASVLKKSGRMSNPSTKSGTFRERTKGAKPINFDPISSTAVGARETLIDYHMTEAVKTVNSAIKKVRDSIDDVKAQREAVNAIENVIKETLESVLNNQFTGLTFGDKAIQKIKKLGYQAALASIPRAGAELGSNMMYAFTKPTEFLSGVKNFSGFSMGSEGMNAMKNLGSSETMRLYDTNAMTSKMVDAGMSYTGAPESQKSLNAVSEKARYISQFTGVGQVRTLATSVADKLISTPDKAISRPMWFGTFSNEFKKETGKSLTSEDMYKIADGTSEYLNENYKEAIDKATIVADRELIKMASSKNPFNIIPKNVQKPNSSWVMNVYKGANTYMASFMLNEYVTARNAVLSVLSKGDMSKVQAGAALTGITMRMASYMPLYSITIGAFDLLFGFENEDDEDDLEDLMKRQLLGAPLSMITGRGLGNVAKIPINYVVEMFNEEFLSSLRSGEDFDSYKHAVVFNQVSSDDLAKKSPEELLIKTFAGPFSPILSSGFRAFKVIKRMTTSAKDETKAKYKKELEDVIILESIGNVGYLPLYKDIRRMVRKNHFKNFEKEKSKKKKEKKKDVFGRPKG